MTLTAIILLVLALYMAQFFLQETSRFGFDLWGIVGNRDKLPEMSVVAARLERAEQLAAQQFIPAGGRKPRFFKEKNGTRLV